MPVVSCFLLPNCPTPTAQSCTSPPPPVAVHLLTPPEVERTGNFVWMYAALVGTALLSLLSCYRCWPVIVSPPVTRACNCSLAVLFCLLICSLPFHPFFSSRYYFSPPAVIPAVGVDVGACADVNNDAIFSPGGGDNFMRCRFTHVTTIFPSTQYPTATATHAAQYQHQRCRPVTMVYCSVRTEVFAYA